MDTTEIRARLDVDYTAEDYKTWTVADIARVRLDAKRLLTEIDRLTSALAAKEELLKQAVEDMKVMALAMRENEELSEGCCFACVCDAQNLPDNCILPYGECPGYDTEDCFEWRGEKKGEG